MMKLKETSPGALTLPIILKVTNPITGVVFQERELDFHLAQDRQDIAKTAWYAMHNGYRLTTEPK